MSQRPHKSAFFTLIHSITWLSDFCPSFSNTGISNIISSPNSLIPDCLIPAPHSRISTYPIRSSKKSANFYSKLLGPEGGFELDLNRANTTVNQHFLPPFTDPRPRFPNIKLSNLSITIKPRLTIVDSFYGYYRSLQEKQIYEIF